MSLKLEHMATSGLLLDRRYLEFLNAITVSSVNGLDGMNIP